MLNAAPEHLYFGLGLSLRNRTRILRIASTVIGLRGKTALLRDALLG